MIAGGHAGSTRGLVVAVALGAVLLSGCQDDSAARTTADTVRTPTSSSTVAASAGTSSAGTPPSGTSPSTSDDEQDTGGLGLDADALPAGLPTPRTKVTDAAGLEAYVDSLTPAQKKLFGEAIAAGMSDEDRTSMEETAKQLKSLQPGALKECTRLVPVGAVVAAIGLTASKDDAPQVKARLAFADQLDDLGDLLGSSRSKKDVQAMATQIRRHAHSGRTLVSSPQLTGAMTDIEAFVEETCGTKN